MLATEFYHMRRYKVRAMTLFNVKSTDNCIYFSQAYLNTTNRLFRKLRHKTHNIEIAHESDEAKI